MRPRRPVVNDRAYSFDEAATLGLLTVRGLARHYGLAITSIRTWMKDPSFPESVGFVEPLAPRNERIPRLWALTDVDHWYARRWPKRAAALKAAYRRGVRDGRET